MSLLPRCGDGIVHTQYGEQCDFGHASPDGMGRIFQVAVGNELTCVLRQSLDAGVVTCRGDTSQLNLQELSTKRFSKIAVVGRSLCGIESATGNIFCQGDSTIASNPNRPTTGGHVDIAGGDTHMCAVGSDNKMTCWGSNCGLWPGGCWDTGVSDLQSVRVTAVAAGVHSTCYLKTDNTIGCFGIDFSRIVSAVPTGQYSQLAVGSSHACAILKAPHQLPGAGALQSGGVVCWGDRRTLPNDPSSSLLNVAGLSATSYDNISLAGAFSCARKTQQSEVQWECWGNISPSDRALLAATGDVTDMQFMHATSGLSGCISRLNGTVLCSGENTYGELPRGFIAGNASPAQRVVMVPWATFLLTPNGNLTVSGSSMSGGYAMPTTNVLDVAGHASALQFGQGGRVIMGGFCAVVQQASSGAGALTCWGSSEYDNILGQNVPLQNDFVQVVVGADYFNRPRPFACALRDGSEQTGYKVVCWGEGAVVANAPSPQESGYMCNLPIVAGKECVLARLMVVCRVGVKMPLVIFRCRPCSMKAITLPNSSVGVVAMGTRSTFSVLLPTIRASCLAPRGVTLFVQATQRPRRLQEKILCS